MCQDTISPTLLAGRTEVLTATGDHPYARLTTTGDELRAYRGGGAFAWRTRWARGTVASALGEPHAALRLLATLADRGELDGVRRVNLPRIGHDALSASLPVSGIDDWDFRWTSVPPPSQPGAAQVRRLAGGDAAATDAAAIGALLDRAFPGTFTRPGDPTVRAWYGVWEDGQLVACGADRSRAATGSISAIAVDPQCRGRGLGAALTATMAQEILTDCDVVTLGVMTDNHRADRLYRRLGFTGCSPRTSADLVC